MESVFYLNNLYDYYKQLINNCKIDIFVSGNVDTEFIKTLEENENLKKLNSRKPEYEAHKIVPKNADKEKIIEESMDVTQGKLVIGLDINIKDEKEKYIVLLYNSILGGSATSKMFQNIREKENLAYVANSVYFRHKNNIFINCGIEIENFQKALKLTKQQIEDMKNGNFTDEEMENSKKGIIATINGIDDEQDTVISYYFGQELAKTKVSLEEYKKIIEKISKEEIINIAKQVSIDTIYFLKN